MGENENPKKKITFLIGAGAEKEIYNMPTGDEFKRDIINCTNVKEIFKKINKNKEINEYNIDNRKIVSYNSCSVLYQTLVESDSFFEKYRDNEVIQAYLNLKKDANSENSEKRKEINENFMDKYRNEFYERIDNKEDKDIEFFLKEMRLFSYIDSYFNYLRLPEKYKKDAGKVMKIYFSAYMSIVSKLGIDESFLKKLNGNVLDNRKAINDKVEELLNEKVNEIIESEKDEKSKEDNYYLILKDIYNKCNIKIITTNYTHFVDRILDIKDDSITHVHGEIGLFENLKNKEIKKLTEFNSDDVIFPYLFVQSGVKPIISASQIEKWHKAIEFINDSDYLVIIGYGINSDDEHITSIIREKCIGKKIIYFIRIKEDEKKPEEVFKNKREKVLNILGNELTIEFHKTSEFEKVISKL